MFIICISLFTFIVGLSIGMMRYKTNVEIDDE